MNSMANSGNDHKSSGAGKEAIDFKPQGETRKTGESFLRRMCRSPVRRWSPLEARAGLPGVTYKRTVEAQTTYSKAASDGLRQLALGGIALIWLLRLPSTTTVGQAAATRIMLTHWQGRALIAFASAVTVDVLQYVYGTVVQSSALDQMEDCFGSSECRWAEADYFRFKRAVRSTFDAFFILKFVSVLLGFGCLVISAFHDGLLS